MDFRIADTFTDALARLSAQEQKAVKTSAFDQCPLERRGRALRTATTPRPASAHASV